MAKEAAVSGGIKGILKRRETDMTSGNIWKHLISFALPLMVGSIFQQLYNTVDTWVVGNYVSNEAFSAVGSVGPIINMLIGFFTGLATGAGVVISQFFGAKRPEEVSATVHTSMAMTFLMGIAFTIIGIVTTPLSLRLMNTPAEVMPEARTYLVIYFAGVLGLMVYNMGAGILRAVGDSNRPFYFLIITAVLNTILDLVFVIVFHMGVAGVAWATIIAQAVSAVLIMIVLVRSRTAVRFSFLKMKIDWKIMGKIVKVGMPAAIQMAITSFSNIFVQGYINHFGADVMSGWTAYAKIDMLAMLPMQSIGLANTTFVGQNLGADLIKRTKQGVNISLILAEGITIVLMIPILIFAPYLVEFFNSKPEVIRYGTLIIHWLSPFYVLAVFNQIYAGALRGSGNSRAPMIIMLFSFVLFRQMYLFICSRYISNTIIPIAMGYPAGWGVCSLLTYIYYKKVNLTQNRIVDD